jgi:hypothetical protein
LTQIVARARFVATKIPNDERAAAKGQILRLPHSYIHGLTGAARECEVVRTWHAVRSSTVRADAGESVFTVQTIGCIRMRHRLRQGAVVAIGAHFEAAIVEQREASLLGPL